MSAAEPKNDPHPTLGPLSASHPLPARCIDEPIHRPGLVQPHGGLLVCDAAATITHASDNVGLWVGRGAQACLGVPLAQLFDGPTTTALQQTCARANSEDAVLLAGVALADAGAATLDLTVTRTAHRVFVELEAAAAEGDDVLAASHLGGAEVGQFFAQLQQSARHLAATPGSVALCQTLCREARKIFGYDRVLVYQFDRHWNGTVMAESRGEFYRPLLGHKFPEGDIPAQARAIFLRQGLRMIPDACASMVPLCGADAGAVDMTPLLARAPSPVHLEYMRNMQTRASLTVSLKLDGRLWGLVACHHATPRYLCARSRSAAELLVSHAGALLQQKLRQDGEAERTRLCRLQQRVVAQLQGADDVFEGLCRGEVNVNAINASGGGCAIHLNGLWRTLGDVPPQAVCDEVVRWLLAGEPMDVRAVENLADHVPAVADHLDRACGLMALSLPQDGRAYVLWFRPEWVRETTWAGNPHEHVDVQISAETGAAHLHPRKSFENYREVMRGHSVPISPQEMDAARALRKGVIEFDLTRSVALERGLRQAAEAERVRAEQAVALREHVLSIVSHDLRNPLGAIELTCQLARRRLRRRAVPPDLAGHLKLLDNVERAGRRMRGLVEDILTVSKMEAGQVPLERAEVDGRALLQEVQQMLAPVAENQQLRLEVHPEAQAVRCNADPERLMQVLSNLVSNAMKFSPQGGTITLHVAEAPQDDAALFEVRDDGPGVAEADRERIFDTFWQADGETAKKGLGLGLSIVKRIVEAHGGGVWVQGRPGRGSTFAFTCPKGEATGGTARHGDN